eukprot:2614927-Alexandrium_andersonii.AAC.1
MAFGELAAAAHPRRQLPEGSSLRSKPVLRRRCCRGSNTPLADESLPRAMLPGAPSPLRARCDGQPRTSPRSPNPSA